MSTTISDTPLVSLETWIGAILSSACIGFTSLVPWLFNMTFFEQSKSQKGIRAKNSRMDYLLSFSVGAILGDIFFHLVPESLESHLVELKVSAVLAQRQVGLSIVSGIFMFIIVEMILEKWSNHQNDNEPVNKIQCDNSGSILSMIKCIDLTETSDIDETNLDFENNNNITTHCDECSHQECHFESSKTGRTDGDLIETEQSIKRRRRSYEESPQKHPESYNLNALDAGSSSSKLTSSLASQVIDPAGYLSLIANGIDNFTHGLAIGASFLVGPKVGLLTTFVIFIHEIPHEICDYAILVNSGFSRWDAVKAQSSVSLFGIMGTATALYFKSIDTLNARMIWILPFSAGGFLHIALVNLLPEILGRGANFRDSLEQIACVILGITFMGAVALS